MAATITIGILQTDELPEEFEQRFQSLENVYAELFQDERLSFKLFRLFRGERPSLDEADVFIIGGSRESVYSESDVTKVVLNYIKQIRKQRKPLVGICYGHQAVAYALGGEVKASPKGWEVGLTPIHFTNETGPLKIEPNGPIVLPSFHHDEVTKLPKNATLLASNDFSRVQAFLVDDHIVCFQSHPEFSNDIFSYFLHSDRNNISQADKVAAEKSLSLSNQREKIGKVLRKFISSLKVDHETQRINQ